MNHKSRLETIQLSLYLLIWTNLHYVLDRFALTLLLLRHFHCQTRFLSYSNLNSQHLYLTLPSLCLRSAFAHISGHKTTI